MTPKSTWILLAAWLFLPHSPALAETDPATKEPDGAQFEISGGFLRIQFLTDTIVRVAFAKDPKFFTRETIARVSVPPYAFSGEVMANPKDWTLSSPQLTVSVDRKGRVRFLDPEGHPLLSEAEGGRLLEEAQVQGEATFHVGQRWDPNPGEALYGLGEHQLGILNLKGYDLDLWQHNTNAVIPFLVSSAGYGIFWDNTSFTRFGDLRDFTPIPPKLLSDDGGKRGGLSFRTVGMNDDTPTFATEIHIDNQARKGYEKPKTLAWTGFVKAPETGEFQFDAYSNGGLKVWLDGKLVMDHWRQGWLTEHDRARVALKKGQKVPLRVEWNTEQGKTLDFRWKTPDPSPETSLWSEVGDGVDYTFVYGPSLDQVVAGYRTLTGKAPMMPSWAFGLWQSRQRYKTAQESLDVVKGFRKRGIPFDNLVQDWMYWKKDSWGSHDFDPERFPDPDGWINSLHDLKAHVMISVWGKFYPGTDNFKRMLDAGYLYKPGLDEGMKDWIGFPYTFYDAFNPGARQLFWDQMKTHLFRRGIDAWWMDATEPDLTPSPPTLEGVKAHMNPTAMGTASRMLLGYPLMNSRGIYEGQRAAAPNQRVFILTRCGYAGQQRYAAAVWSGDVTSTWTALAKQIPAGLGFSLSGMPYWTTDTGGYTMPWKFSTDKPKPEDEEEWRELNARWFEYSTFCPLLRVHGELRPREMWELGGETSPAYQAELKFDRLRYRMFPYVYSLAGEVTHHAGSFLRPLVMDFPSDPQVLDLTDEYMFGHALLVAPVTSYKARSRTVYLPSPSPLGFGFEGTQGGAPVRAFREMGRGEGAANHNPAWYDFWTGQVAAPGEQEAPAPYDAIPLFVRAGSILPYGPEEQYVGEKPGNPLTLYVYAGASGDFLLYEDDGLTYDYDKGAFSVIPLHWDNATGTLTLGNRQGSFFRGMLSERTFQVVLVSKDHPTGFSFDPKPLKTVKYKGNQLVLPLGK